MLRHFKTERQILAGLRHPHIVTLLDGGVSQDGFAYLAMEYVEGAPITAHVARARAASRRAAAVDAARLQRRAVRASTRHRAPRSEARQHPRDRRRRAEGAGFWRREASRSFGVGRIGDHGWSVAPGAHAQLREPGATARAAGDDRLRHLRAGRAALSSCSPACGRTRPPASRWTRCCASSRTSNRHGRVRGRGRRRAPTSAARYAAISTRSCSRR